MTIDQNFKMKQPVIAFEGREHLVSTISWYSDGSISGVSFKDQNGDFHTAFAKGPNDEIGYSENDILHLDLGKCMKWDAELAELEKVE